jgi:hypothetical protein
MIDQKGQLRCLPVAGLTAAQRKQVLARGGRRQRCGQCDADIFVSPDAATVAKHLKLKPVCLECPVPESILLWMPTVEQMAKLARDALEVN